MSDEGSDQNDCLTESTPCQNLQSVLNRAMDGVDIYVTSDKLLLKRCKVSNCEVNSSLSYNIRRINSGKFNVICAGLYLNSKYYSVAHNTFEWSSCRVS